MIWCSQHQHGSVSTIAKHHTLLGSSNGPSTRLEENDFVMPNPSPGHGTNSNPGSGHATPTESSADLSQPQNYATLAAAVTKLREIWYRGIELQYPSIATTPLSSQIRRVGFCRDGEHFIYLAEMFLGQSGFEQTRMHADHRFQWVMRLLKQIRRYVGENNMKAGKEIGAVVDIKDEYGGEDLTLNMKLLFTPLPSDTNSPLPMDNFLREAHAYAKMQS